MTAQQKEWLDKNRAQGWETVGMGRKYSRRGLLHVDGTMEETGRSSRPRRVEQGSFEVGLKERP